jgi:broad specificity phosphatase PhoE
MTNRTFFRVGVVLMIMGSGFSAVYAQKLVFVVRHAERADGGPGQMQAQPDPPLSAAGIARAEQLASMLADAGIQAIFATEYRRTADTAKPLASKLGLEISKTAAKDSSALLSELRSRHGNQVVLVVGHSNTVPAIIKALCGAALTIGDDEYDNLFIVVPENRTMTRIRF